MFDMGVFFLMYWLCDGDATTTKGISNLYEGRGSARDCCCIKSNLQKHTNRMNATITNNTNLSGLTSSILLHPPPISECVSAKVVYAF